MNFNLESFLLGIAFAILLVFASLVLTFLFKKPKRECSWNDQIPEEIVPLEEVRRNVRLCIRAPGHEGPCNGYPRPSCPAYETWKKVRGEGT